MVPDQFSLRRITLFTGPRRIYIGLDSLKVLSDEIRRFDSNRPLIVTDPNMERLGYLERVMRQLPDVETEVFSEVRGEPSVRELEHLAAHVRRGEYDLILGLGGGSVMDSAKVASISATNKGSIEDFIGVDRVDNKGLPLICIPTTSGTGSEVTKFAVIKYEKTKKAVTSDLIIPDVAIVDPLLTVSLPPKLTAYTGLDALSHAVEAVISTWATPFTDTLALGAIRTIFRYLKRAYEDGGDLEARYNMSMAATLAGLSFNDPKVLLAHSIGQTIGPIYDLPHGLSVAVSLPYILDFYLPSSANKIALISEAAGIYSSERTDEENARRLISWLVRFYRELEIPLSLREFGACPKDIDELAECTVKFQPRSNSPISITKENMVELYRKMLKGMGTDCSAQ
jgi:alcohol dehydrogenase class IV